MRYLKITARLRKKLAILVTEFHNALASLPLHKTALQLLLGVINVSLSRFDTWDSAKLYESQIFLRLAYRWVIHNFGPLLARCSAT